MTMKLKFELAVEPGVEFLMLSSFVIIRSSGISTFRLSRRFQRSISTTAMQKPKIITEASEAVEIAGNARNVAVLGIKPSSKASQPAYFVPEFLQSTGVKIIPVPVFFPEVTEILGEPVVRNLRDVKVEGRLDVLDIFRRPDDLPQHLEDILNMNPRPDVVWLQTGISNPEFEKALVDNGFTVVESRCLKVDRAAAGHRSKI